MNISMMILLAFLFSGCYEKVVFQDKLICTEQLLIPRVAADIRIHKDDLYVARSYKESLDSAFHFYEEQVIENNKLCGEKQ